MILKGTGVSFGTASGTLGSSSLTSLGVLPPLKSKISLGMLSMILRGTGDSFGTGLSGSELSSGILGSLSLTSFGVLLPLKSKTG